MYSQKKFPFGLTGVIAITAGGIHTGALKNDGTVVAWGDNWYGQIAVPAGLTGVIAIAAGSRHTVVLKNYGTVVAWGNNGSGQTTVPARCAINGIEITGTISYDQSTGIATITPFVPLEPGWQFTAAINGVRNLNGIQIRTERLI